MSGCLQFSKCLFYHHYLEYYVVGGCVYNQQYPELYFLWAQTLFVELPVSWFDGNFTFIVQ
jgi:hypothetical protein